MSSFAKKIRLSQEPVVDSDIYGIIRLPSNEFTEKFNEMRINNQLLDIKIIANNGDEFLAHKVVLAAKSEYFNIMFNGGFKEATESEIIIHGLDPHALKLLLKFIYTSELIITEQYIQEILIGICLLQLDESVYNDCVDLFKSYIHVSNCLNMKEMANILGLKDFDLFCLDYILENYKQVTENEEFVLIRFDQILTIIKNNGLCSKEEVVYLSVMKWINHDLDNRSKHLPELLEYIRLPLVSPEFLKYVDTEPLLKSNDCTKYLSEAYAFQTVNGTGLEVSNTIRTQNRSNYAEYILIMSNSGKKRSRPLLFNYETGKWKEMSTVLPNYSGTSLMMLEDGRILNIGGLRLTNHSDTRSEGYYLHWNRDEEIADTLVMPMNYASIYDFSDNSWLDIAPMLGLHCMSKVVQIGVCVYVIGSYRSEYYNIELNKWFSMNSIIFTGICHEVIVLNGLIYVVGGKINRTELNAVYVYDPDKNNWTYGPPMLYTRAFPSLCVFKNCIYAIGGWKYPNDYLDTVEKYDPATRTWTEVANLNKSRCRAGVVVMYGQIYVFGGSNSNYTIEAYCPYKNKWSILVPKIPNILGCDGMCNAYLVKPNFQNKFLTSTDIY